MARDQAKWFCLVVIVTACCVRSFFVFHTACATALCCRLRAFPLSLYADSHNIKGCPSHVHYWQIMQVWLLNGYNFCVDLAKRRRFLKHKVFFKHSSCSDIIAQCGWGNFEKLFFKSGKNILQVMLSVSRLQNAAFCLCFSLPKLGYQCGWVTVMIHLTSLDKVAVVSNWAMKRGQGGQSPWIFPLTCLNSVFRVQEVNLLSHLTNVDGPSCISCVIHTLEMVRGA